MAMPQSLEDRVGILEEHMGKLEGLPEAVGLLTSQISQLSLRMEAEFSAIRKQWDAKLAERFREEGEMLDERFAQVVAQMDQRFVHVDRGFTRVKKDLAVLRKDTGILRRGVGTILKKLDAR